MNPVAKRTVTALTVAALVASAIVYVPACWLPWAFAVLSSLAVAEFAVLLSRKLKPGSARFALSFVAGAAIISAGLSALPVAAFRHGSLMMLYLVAIIKFSDMGGFAFGLGSQKLFGRNHKMCPTISPGKSWEGLLGSVIGSVIMSLSFLPITGFSVLKAVLFGVTAALVGTVGDLVESKFKRWAGVKDSSTMKITNGMGGFLDMFDSLIFAPALLLPFIG